MFFAVMLIYYLVISVLSFSPFKRGLRPHHYQIAICLFLACVICLFFIERYGENDLFVAVLWGNLIVGVVTFVIDIEDFAYHIKLALRFAKRKKGALRFRVFKRVK